MRCQSTWTRMAEIEKIDNVRRTGGCEGTRTLIPSWWEGELMYPLWQSVCQYPLSRTYTL